MYAPDPKGPFPAAARHRLYGMYPALVTSVTDPHNQGRVQVELPWVAEDDGAEALAWARLATLMAGDNRGSWFIPEVGDEVLLAFIAGDPRWPIVVGALWNGVDTPPEQMDGGGENNLRSITSRSGHRFTFDDTSGAEKVEIQSQGNHFFSLEDSGGGAIKLKHSGGAKIEIDSSGNVSIDTGSKVTVSASTMEVSVGTLTVNAGLSKFSGVVQADTVITNAVVSASYTPGAGNVW